ncbi:MAG: MFS transporter [Candidatus Paceibacterota bacterium]
MLSHSKLIKIRSVFAVSFILTISMALTSYIDSSFIETFIVRSKIGILFALASFGSLFYISQMPKVLERFGVYRTLKGVASIYILSILGLVFLKEPILLQIIFILYWISAVAMYLTVDVLVSHYSDNASTGNTRGFYLTIYNLAFLMAPFIAGILVSKISFEGVYLVSGFFVLSMTYFFTHKFKYLKLFPKKNGFNFISDFIELFKNKDLRNVYLVNFTLYFFFAWMTIYMPIYLFENVGLSWQEIGAVFAIMHLPYVLFDIPWGKIADKILGEKEIMGAGIIIMGLCTISIGFIEGSELWIWASALALTRLGASMIQVSVETYFFKKINKEDTSKISIFRNASPIAVLIGPIVATLALSIANYRELFIILGVLVLFALIPNHKLHDTR